MSFSEKIQAVMLNWNEEEFKKLHDPEFMFIRDTELITMDDWITNMEEFSSSGAYAKRQDQSRRTSLVHENRQVTEWRWEEGDELVTHVCMKKKGRAWRSIVYRETIEDFKETLS
ncbi:hypothetical protein GN241_09660 [Rhodobacteraceae bacterium IMCC1335]